MTPDPSVELNEKLVELNVTMSTSRLGVTEPNPYNPAGNLRAGGYELLGGHRQ